VAEAKRYHGTECKVCGFSFSAKYGEIGDGYIECHHLRPMSMDEARPTKLEEVTVLCANCHRMAHRRSPPYSVDELRANLRK
jgi:5-methylcytosine-specific restriction protein A